MSDLQVLPEQADGLAVNLSHMPFATDDGIAPRAAIGVVVLASDNTIEHEFRQLLGLPGVAFFESRIEMSTTVNSETLRAMESRIAGATALILPGAPLDVVAFGCTSASMVIGEEKVADKIREARPDMACTNPMTSAFAAFRSLRVQRVALLTPYIDEINQGMRRHLEVGGLSVTAMGSFNEENDNKVAKISPDSVREAALTLGRHQAVDGVFVSCTSLRLADVVVELEAELGKPVTSSNHAMAWHCLRLAGVKDHLPHFGSLFERDLV